MKKTMVYICVLMLAACAGPLGPNAPGASVGLTRIPSPEKTLVNPTIQPAETETLHPQPIESQANPTRAANLNTNSYSPQSGDSSLKREQAYLDSVLVKASTDDPQAAQAVLTGSMPTPCHQLRIRTLPENAKNTIKIEIYSLVDPSAVCAEMITPFEFGLSLGELNAGKYSLSVNDKTVLAFTWPEP